MMRKAVARPDGARAFGRFLSRQIERSIVTMLQWADRRRQRHALRQLSDAMLKDIGLTRADVEGEAAKPFWMP